MAASKDVARFTPRDPEQGDFAFIGVSDDQFDPNDWPAEPSAYRPSLHFQEYYRRFDRYLTGEIINKTITNGNLVPGLNDTGAFYHDTPGVVYYLIVGWDRSSPDDSDDRVVVTGWPHVYDRDAAMDAGRFSTRAINEIQKINGTLFNTTTADHDWLDYYETVKA